MEECRKERNKSMAGPDKEIRSQRSEIKRRDPSDPRLLASDLWSAQQFIYQIQQPRWIYWLGQVSTKPGLQGSAAIIVLAIAGDCDDGNALILRQTPQLFG